MSHVGKAAAVVAGWIAGNAVLLALLPFFGESPFAIILFAVSIALPTAFAAGLLAFAGHNPDPEDGFTLGANAVWTLPAALGLVLIGVGSFAGVVAAWIGALLVAGSLLQLLRGSIRFEAPAGDHDR